ncbi:hypothetical protein K0M31_007970, partial [Melipona bicolor]
VYLHLSIISPYRGQSTAKDQFIRLHNFDDSAIRTHFESETVAFGEILRFEYATGITRQWLSLIGSFLIENFAKLIGTPQCLGIRITIQGVSASLVQAILHEKISKIENKE